MPATPHLLRMRRNNLENLPPWQNIELAKGYAIRHYQPGDEKPWTLIIQESMSLRWSLRRARKKIFRAKEFNPENVFFATWNNEPIGTASAWPESPSEPDTGRVHMVGVYAAHRGRGLGFLLSLRVLHRMRELGLQQAVLNTEDDRYEAVRIYLKLGFTPEYVTEKHVQRWQYIIDSFETMER